MAAAVVSSPDGRRSVIATVGAFEIARLEFPPAFAHGVVDPSRSYVVVVLDGAVCKTFRRESTTLAGGTLATLPAGAAHSSAFAQRETTRVLALRATDERAPFGAALDRRRDLRIAAASALASRMSSELETGDAASELALEGCALQLVASRQRAHPEGGERPGSWLARVREILHELSPAQPSLAELADAVGRHPAHVARAFRREYGSTIGEYVRALRLERATALLAEDLPLARIAQDAGFADQSHFTRAFRRHTGLTPARYRARIWNGIS